MRHGDRLTRLGDSAESDDSDDHLVLNIPASTSSAIIASYNAHHNDDHEYDGDSQSSTTTLAKREPSAWMRNAGRKKSHPVWSFFEDRRTAGTPCPA